MDPWSGSRYFYSNGLRLGGLQWWLIWNESPLRMSETYSCLFLFDIELKFIEEDIIFILKGFTSCFFFRECDKSKTSSRSSGVTQVHSHMFHLTEFTKKWVSPWIPGRWTKEGPCSSGDTRLENYLKTSRISCSDIVIGKPPTKICCLSSLNSLRGRSSLS